MTRSEPHAPRSGCPIATTLDMLGDRWSLIVVRDLLNGKSRFGEFLASPERIATSVLADRLDRLEAVGIVRKRAYQSNPVRHDYYLTDTGRGLLPVLQEVCRWANTFFPGTWRVPEAFMTRRP
jgi:DNA-binding HxlR family transcriptional regulator